MLSIDVESREFFDESKQEFVPGKACTLQLEHSLISMSKWEAKWKKPFLAEEGDRAPEEVIDYIRCMTVSPQNVPDYLYYALTESDFKRIQEYINDPMTATWFNEANSKSWGKRRANRGVVTSERIYYWMVSYNIPFECQKWHLNRLLTLIHVCDLENQPKKKMSKRDIYSRNSALNAMRKAQSGSLG